MSQSVAATAAGRDQNGAPIATGPLTWSSDAPTVATVSSDGAIATVAPGRVTISAAAGGRTGQATLEVTPGPPASLARSATDSLFGTVGSPLANAPSVVVRDARGFPVPNIPVTFAVTTGGGTLATPTSTTNAQGIATAGAWTLGTTVGLNTLTATVATLAPVTISATANPGAAAAISAGSPTTLAGIVGKALSNGPQVVVRDAFGNLVPGATVAFAPATGSGAVSAPTAATSAQGVASAGTWTLGTTAGTHTLSARVGALPPVTFTATAAPDTPTSLAAVARVRKLFVYSVPALFVSRAAGTCGTESPAINEAIAGVVVLADVRSVDGRGGNLGSAGWCNRRLSPFVTALGSMTLDADDLAADLDQAYETVIHELLHVMGFGSSWELLGLVSGSLTSDPWFNGTFARTAFTASGGATYLGNRVPLENVGGSGTRLGHWRSSIMYNEMMTGYACAPGAALSFITVSSFFDMNVNVAVYGDDDFTFTGSGCAGVRAPRAEEVPLAVTQELIDVRTGRVVGPDEIRAALSARVVLPLAPRVVPEQVLQRTRRE